MGLFGTLIVLAAAMIVMPTTLAAAANIDGTSKSDTLYGTKNADTIKGYAGNDKIYGYGGNDQLYGSTGDDMLRGGDGNDRLYGWYGANKLYGGSGNDYLISTNNQNGDSSGTNYLHGGPGRDYLEGTGCDGCGTNFYFAGGEGNDHIVAYGPGTIDGGSGSDIIEASCDCRFTVYGGSGNDRISVSTDGGAVVYGGVGNDYIKTFDSSQLFGGDGDDTLATEYGFTEYTGGAGADNFQCSPGPGDSVLDYDPAQGDVVSADCEEY